MKLSNSQIQTFKQCRRKWWFSYRQGLEKKHYDPTGPLGTGGRLHTALEAYYTGGDMFTAHSAALHDDNILPTDDVGVLETRMLKTYRGWVASTGADDGWEVASAEQPVTIPMHSLAQLGVAVPPQIADWELYGIIDLVVKKPDGTEWFVDHKTVKAWPTHNLQQDEQILMYHLLRTLDNRDGPVTPAEGAIYNMVRKIVPSKRTKPPYVKRVEITHNEDEIVSFAHRVVGVALDIHHTRERLTSTREFQPWVYPHPSKDCSWCPFNTVCPMVDDGSRFEAYLNEHYQKREGY